MTVRSPLTLPPRTPSSWELRLPGYPVITGAWRSSAFPEILGGLPSGAEWSLAFENQTSNEALGLLLPWRATGGGQWPLTTLPDELAGGVNDENFRKRLIGTTWAMAEKPRKEPVKNGRFNVTILLVHELAFDSVYGPGNPRSPATSDNPLALGLLPSLTVVGLPVALAETPQPISIEQQPRYIATLDGRAVVTQDGKALVTQVQSLFLAMNLPAGLTVVGLPVEINGAAEIDANSGVLNTGLIGSLSVIALPASLAEVPAAVNATAVVSLNLSADLSIAGIVLLDPNIPVNSIVYGQSSVFAGTFAADNLSMTDKTLANTGAATDLGSSSWIKMDLGRNYGIAKVVIGTASSTIPGSWSRADTENKLVQYSSDNINWTTAFDTGTFPADGIYPFDVNFTARYIMIATPGAGYVALSEFYALAAGQAY